MLERRSLKLPITLGVAMIVSIVTLIVGWVLLTVFGARTQPDSSVYWTLLTVGTILLAMVLAGAVTYLTLSVKAINLNRRQSNFIDSVTHELKSPIASLKLYLQTMNRRELTDEEQAKFRQFMMNDVERLDQLITHMLDAGLTEKKQSTEDVEEFNLASAISDCADTVCLRYRVERDIVSSQLVGCTIRAPRRDVMMIFRNLIDNAVKYAGSPPEVVVTMEVVDQMAVVRIADNGPGIPAQLRRKVFGRFVRLGKELERKKPGTGLGLYIVRTLTRRLRGKVTVVDNSSHQGTVFEVRLPVIDSAHEVPSKQNSGTRPNPLPDSTGEPVAN
ncbi:MAG: HAMP domain-containing sensor histidine kinase [Planctomycetota bacterium]